MLGRGPWRAALTKNRGLPLGKALYGQAQCFLLRKTRREWYYGVMVDCRLIIRAFPLWPKHMTHFNEMYMTEDLERQQMQSGSPAFC